jgi:hypothetical protein
MIKIIKLTLKDLLKDNLHLLKLNQNYWADLLFDITLNKFTSNSQNYLFLKIAFAFVNLKKCLTYLEYLGLKRKHCLLFSTNMLIFYLFLKKFKFMSLGLSLLNFKWINGFLTNYKFFYKFYLKKLHDVFSLISNFVIDTIDDHLMSQLYFFSKFKTLPSLVCPIELNKSILNEAFLLQIPSVNIVDSMLNNEFLNKGTFLIPINFESNIKIYFIFFKLLLSSLVLGLLKRKKLFFKLLNFILICSKKSSNLSITIRKRVNYIYSFLIHFIKLFKFY